MPAVRGRRAVALMLLVLCACADPPSDVPAGTPGVVMRDSAGVEIVENSAPLWGESEGWVIDPDPVLQIGAVDGSEPYQLTWAHHATRLPDGSIAVVEGFTREIRVFGSDGVHLRTVGRAGEGPGEFMARPELAVAAPDTLLAWDPTAKRISRFLLDGTLLGESSLREWFASQGIARVGLNDRWTLRPDGRLVIGESPIPYLEKGGTTQAYIVPYLVSSGGPYLIRLDSLPEMRWIGMQSKSGALMHGSDLFAPEARVAAGTEVFPLLVGDGERWEVRHYDSEGALGRVVRVEVPIQPINPGVRADARRRLLAASSMSSIISDEMFEWAAEQWVDRDALPPLGAMIVGRDDHLWVERRRMVPTEGDLVFDVIDPDGRWLGPVQVPDGLGQITEFGPDWVLAWWTDELDVLYARMHRILEVGA